MRRPELISLFICILWLNGDRGASACHCIRLGKCASFARLLLHHGPGEQSAVFAKVHDASCGFQGLELLVCCPTSRKQIRDDSFLAKPSRMMRFAPPVDRWIWDDGGESTGSRHSHSHSDYLETETNLHNYWDFGEQRNCPPVVEPEFFDKRFGLGHHFLYQVEHGDEGTTSTRPTPKDKPIVFPGDLRFLQQGEEDVSFNIEKGPPLAPFTTTPPTTIATSPPSTTPTSILPLRRENPTGCGMSVESRLLGGEQATAGQYPWLARIAYRNRSSSRSSFRCSGSLISSNHIVTAAHCVINLVSDLESHVRLGSQNDSNSFAIERVIVHPNYDQPKYANDIAVVRINSTNGAFTPICLPLEGSTTLGNRLIGQTGVAAGWSTGNPENNRSVDSANTSAGVRFIRLPIVNTTSCAIAYASLSENFQQPIVITPNHLCAQGMPMNDVCRGDSGGPFMDDGTSGLFGTSGRHTLIGIVAFGPTLCGVTTIPGVYTLVSSFSDWILRSINGETNQ
ncbi:CLIP domain-containing serine protease 2 isoform X2 [Drosophila ficusphila]|uniref:CLIP domain-containing serine protease 2 isoform X2 n=1 Tax=Drosophila ficusphila TaxID=30025 RepID=UPI0007E829CE|nr:CLIP domain-containing serine protease 2 isoform X2 [Drosophila ficusphila]